MATRPVGESRQGALVVVPRAMPRGPLATPRGQREEYGPLFAGPPTPELPLTFSKRNRRRRNRPWGLDSDWKLGRLTPGPLDRAMLAGMESFVADARQIGADRAPVLDEAGSIIGWRGGGTAQSKWMRVPGGTKKEYFKPGDVLEVLADLQTGRPIPPHHTMRRTIADHLDSVLQRGDAGDVSRHVFGVADPRDLPPMEMPGPQRGPSQEAGAPDDVPFDIPALPVSRPTVRLDSETGTMILGDRSPFKGRYSMVNARRGWRVFGSRGLALGVSNQAQPPVGYLWLSGAYATKPAAIRALAVGLQPAARASLARSWRIGTRNPYKVTATYVQRGGVATTSSSHIVPTRAEARRMAEQIVKWTSGSTVIEKVKRRNPGWTYRADAIAFRALPVGAVFQFDDRDFPFSGMERGPWRKVSARGYVALMPTHRLWGHRLNVGSVHVAVLPFPETLSRGRNPLTRAETAAVYRTARRDRALAREHKPRTVMRGYFLGRMDAEESVGQRYGATRRRRSIFMPSPGLTHNPRRDPQTGQFLPRGRNPLTRAETTQVMKFAKKSRDLRQHWRADPPASQYWRGRSDAWLDAAYLYGEGKRGSGGHMVRERRYMNSRTRSARPRVVGPIPGRMTRIEYTRTGRHPGKYYHNFQPASGVQALALADGSVLLRGRRKLYVRQ